MLKRQSKSLADQLGYVIGCDVEFQALLEQLGFFVSVDSATSNLVVLDKCRNVLARAAI